MKKLLYLLLAISIAWGSIILFTFLTPEAPLPAPEEVAAIVAEPEVIPRGIWITVFSKKKVLYSQSAIDELMTYCEQNGITEIYLQIYRSGEAYYDSAVMQSEKYKAMVAAFGKDPISYLLDEAEKRSLSVHAWINVLSIAQNSNAPIIKKYGNSVLTRDRAGRSSIRSDAPNETDKSYLRDHQIFLEPGDEQVREWTLAIADDIITRYPHFSGLHLDYIRYPYPVPAIPDSRFIDQGISYGYGENNVARFRDVTEKNPLSPNMYENDLFLAWDNWKRDQVTFIVEKISELIESKSETWQLSCAVIPSYERAYSVAYQDWPLWLEKGLIDHVVTMNYSRDERLASELARGSLAYRGQGKVYTGIGTFIFKDENAIRARIQLILATNPDGLVIFSYDDIADVTDVFNAQ
jgi:uncharacterized lipoprotein YddW (UPF0748 family)